VHVPNKDSGLVSPWHLDVEIIPNPIWRIGRLFFACPGCNRRAARLYVPLSGSEPRCRGCWGLNYTSQSWSYHGGLWQRIPCYVTTTNKREAARRAARERYAKRRLKTVHVKALSLIRLTRGPDGRPAPNDSADQAGAEQ
jgi:hypothetical protein